MSHLVCKLLTDVAAQHYILLATDTSKQLPQWLEASTILAGRRAVDVLPKSENMVVLTANFPSETLAD